MGIRGKAAKTLSLVDACVGILREIQPATVRAVCYRLFISLGLIPSMAKKHTNAVGTQLVWAREQGLVPWEWIVDETRDAERISTWSSPVEIIDAAVRGYRRNYWQDQPHWIEVFSEKGTVRGTLKPILEKYGITFRVMHGYGSATALHDIASETYRADKPLTILYVGDFDCSGMHMSEIDIPSRLARYAGSASIRRVALTDDDVKAGSDLPSFEAKPSDPRYTWYVSRYGNQCWELDALSPNILRDRVEQTILEMLDFDAWNHALQIEKAEVESMRGFANAWKHHIFRQASKCDEEGRP